MDGHTLVHVPDSAWSDSFRVRYCSDSTQGNSSVSLNTSDTPTDGELVHRARRGDEIALSQLVERYQRAAYAVALSVTGRHEDAEDAAQESFLMALKRLDEWNNMRRERAHLIPTIACRCRATYAH